MIMIEEGIEWKERGNRDGMINDKEVGRGEQGMM
jgi:hypothetical protein